MAVDLVTRGLVVHDIGPFDVGRLARLHRACFDDAWSRKDLAHLLAMPGGFGLLARATGFRRLGFETRRVVGFSLCRVVREDSELLSIGIRPEHRQRGVGQALLDEAMTRCRTYGAQRMFLEVAVDNDPAQRLYTRAGFFPVGKREAYYRRTDGSMIAALTMRADLEAS